jgi:hypothetical protein
MLLQKAIVIASVLLISSLPAFAASEQDDLRKQAQLNGNVLYMERDASMFLHSLVLMKAGDGMDVQNFMEHKIDEIVCAAWEQQDKMTPGQKKRVMAFLQEIKAYRAKNPRVAGTVVDPEKFSKYFMPFDATAAQRADATLAGLQ